MIELHSITDIIAYWVLGWSIINLLLPPAELFPNPPGWYQTVLKLVAYYGAMNVRGITTKIYSKTNGGEKKP